MGLIETVFGFLFGGNRNVVKETVEVFRENAENASVRTHQMTANAMGQYTAEFQVQNRTKFDSFMDGLNRLPRPFMAIGVIFLFGSAMYDPAWFEQRMIPLVFIPDALWILLSIIVTFYFGGRFQAKSLQGQREVFEAMAAQMNTSTKNPEEPADPVLDDNPILSRYVK